MSQLFTEQAKLREGSGRRSSQVHPWRCCLAMSLTRRCVWQPVSVPPGSAGKSHGTIELLGAEPPPRRDHPHRRALLAAVAAGGRCCQGVSCRLNLRLSPASRTSRFFRPPRLRRRGNGFGRPRQLGDTYRRPKWLTMRRWLEANPADEFAQDVRAKLTSEPERYAATTREYLGWGVFALMPAVYSGQTYFEFIEDEPAIASWAKGCPPPAPVGQRLCRSAQARNARMCNNRGVSPVPPLSLSHSIGGLKQ